MITEVYDLKCWPELFQGVVTGTKLFEFRKDDRGGYRPGDIFHLREWKPGIGEKEGWYTGRAIEVIVQSVWGPDQIPGIPEGYVLMGISSAVRYATPAQQGYTNAEVKGE